jgi:hypothetical protein
MYMLAPRVSATRIVGRRVLLQVEALGPRNADVIRYRLVVHKRSQNSGRVISCLAI